MADLITPLFGVLVGTFVAGSIYSLMAMGLSLLWSTVNLVNFAHGAILATGAYFAWYFSYITGFTPFIVIMMPVMFFWGILADLVLFRKIRIKYEKDASLRLILLTLTLAVVIEQLLYIVFGGTRKRVPTLIEGNIRIGNVVIFNQHILASVIAIFTLVILYLILTKTITGMAIRSIGQSMQESLVIGVDVERLYHITVGIGFMLAGISGMLLGSIYIFDPSFGRGPLLIAYIIVVLGGVRNIKGAIYASFIVAAIESLTTFFLGGPWRIAILFLAMMTILMIRPYGLFGVKEEIMR